MCDYSLESFARRDAQVRDQLTTAKIGGYGSVGLVASDAPQTAVCLCPGTRLIVSAIPAHLQRAWGVGEVAIATFEQREATVLRGMWSRDGRYRDGVRFDGWARPFILFQDFPVGMEISVETIPGMPQDSAPPPTIKDEARREPVSV
jgi:hypothetical protein